MLLHLSIDKITQQRTHFSNIRLNPLLRVCALLELVEILIRWACEETKVYVKSISEISGGLPKVVESMQFAMSFCSLLETQSLVLRPYLIKHIRPGMEVVLQIHIDHYKKLYLSLQQLNLGFWVDILYRV